MFCNNCGQQLENNAAFCTNCGQAVGNQPPEPYAYAGETSSSAPKAGMSKNLIAAIVAAVALIAIALVVAFLVIPGTAKQDEAAAPSTTASSASSKSTADNSQGAGDATAEDAVFETNDMRITTPAAFASEGYSWESNPAGVSYLKNGAGETVAGVGYGDFATKQQGFKSDTFTIGAVSHGTQAFTTMLRIYYLNEEGKPIVVEGTSSPEAGTPANEGMGISAEELVSWIELYNVDHFEQAAITHAAAGDADESAREASNPISSPTSSPISEPFWGVWISASKDSDAANDLARKASEKGLNGTVFFTTDWSNLNPEPWYVVAAGYSRTEAEAESLCEQAKAAGYEDAYVKYSGDYQG